MILNFCYVDGSSIEGRLWRWSGESFGSVGGGRSCQFSQFREYYHHSRL